MGVMLLCCHVFNVAPCSMKVKNVANSLSLVGHPCIRMTLLGPFILQQHSYQDSKSFIALLQIKTSFINGYYTMLQFCTNQN